MIKVTDKEYWMDGYLQSNLNTIIYNLPNDWSSIIIISGSGKVRVGKSVIAQQIGYYCAYKLHTPFTVDNVVFSGQDLVDTAKKLPKNSVIVYDEGRAELDTKKMMENVTKFLLDFFAECGAYNHLVIICMPDYFEMPKMIAVNMSECLINCVKVSQETKDKDGEAVLKWERGLFEFYNEKRKKKLYELGRKNNNDYDMGKNLKNFFGTFKEYYPVDEEAYKKKKIEFMRRDRSEDSYVKRNERRIAVTMSILNEFLPTREIEKRLKAKGLDISQSRVSQFIKSANDSPSKTPLE